MDNLNGTNLPLCNNNNSGDGGGNDRNDANDDYIAVNELRIDEDDIKEKTLLELDVPTKLSKSEIDDSPENIQKDSWDGLATSNTTSNDVSSSSNSCAVTPISHKTIAPTIAAVDSGDIETKNKAGFAFTIDFNDGKMIDNKKHREIVERFQNRQQQQQNHRRHRRGVSLSKLDDNMRALPIGKSFDDISTGLVNKPPIREKQLSAKTARQYQSGVTDNNNRESLHSDGVVLRRRPHQYYQTNSDGLVGNKRHSWSPQTSVKDEAVNSPMIVQLNTQESTKRKETNSSSFFPKSSILQKALESGRMKTKQTVRETKLDVITTPLEYVKLSDDGGSADAVSEAGTYTLDGDHYTEEEKERMSIDKDNKRILNTSRSGTNLQQQSHKPTTKRTEQNKRIRNLSNTSMATNNSSRASDLSKQSATAISNTQKISYLDKIKSRVKNFGDSTFHKLPISRNVRATSETLISAKSDDEKDMGTFTSVTACGVLNKSTIHPSVRNKPRKNSLTKLQIDASEYIQPSLRTDETMMKSYTDYEKAKQNEYQLNIFSTSHMDGQLDMERPPSLSIKTAPTKNDWIQEWARNARRRNILLSATTTTAAAAAGAAVPTATPTTLSTNSSKSPNPNSAAGGGSNKKSVMKSDDFIQTYRPTVQSGSEFGDEIQTDDDELKLQYQQNNIGVSPRRQTNSSVTARPPLSPTKIPSPMHSSLRVRGTSVNRSFRSSYSELDQIETEMYLEKTAEAISSLKRLQRENSSPQNTNRQRNSYNYDTDYAYQHLNVHKRNLSLDGTSTINYGQSFDLKNGVMKKYDQRHRGHVRHNSYESKLIALDQNSGDGASQRNAFDQTSPSQQQQQRKQQYGDSLAHAYPCSPNSPIRRSTSFSVKHRDRSMDNMPSSQVHMNAGRIISAKTMAPSNHMNGKGTLQKSASSSSFTKLVLQTTTPISSSYRTTSSSDDYNDDMKYYINDDTDLNLNEYSNDNGENVLYMTDDSDENIDDGNVNNSRKQCDAPISHTRYNKAFLMRVEQSKQTASMVPRGTSAVPPKGLIACPNTPEMPRRNSAQRASFRDRTSMPRDSSLSRIKQDLPNLKTMKKTLTSEPSKALSTTSSGSTKSQGKVLPKYLDISKYKSSTGQGTFLRRNESKSTLINRNEIKKSPSAIGLSKMESSSGSATGRVKSAGAKSNSASSKEKKAREAELAMWRRRATYDPMKAAAEGKRKSIQKPKDSISVLRSQSFHSGVGHYDEQSSVYSKFSENRCNADFKMDLFGSSEDEEEEEFIESS